MAINEERDGKRKWYVHNNFTFSWSSIKFTSNRHQLIIALPFSSHSFTYYDTYYSPTHHLLYHTIYHRDRPQHH